MCMHTNTPEIFVIMNISCFPFDDGDEYNKKGKREMIKCIDDVISLKTIFVTIKLLLKFFISKSLPMEIDTKYENLKRVLSLCNPVKKSIKKKFTREEIKIYHDEGKKKKS